MHLYETIFDSISKSDNLLHGYYVITCKHHCMYIIKSIKVIFIIHYWFYRLMLPISHTSNQVRLDQTIFSYLLGVVSLMLHEFSGDLINFSNNLGLEILKFINKNIINLFQTSFIILVHSEHFQILGVL